jgi:predicted  nucleic acid-binding Zn-ribbon protein
LGENEHYIIENERLNSELVRLEEVYGGKIRELESQIDSEQKNFDEIVGQYNNEFQKFKKDGQEYIENIQF